MNIKALIKDLEKFTTDNSPLILTALGVTGVITTGILAAKGGAEALRRIEAEEERLKWRKADDEQKAVLVNAPPQMTIKDKVALTWTAYAPACGAGAFTITAVVLSNRISTRRAAAMAAAYSISLEAFDEYKDKVKEKLGERKEQNLRDELAQDRVTRDGEGADKVVIVTGSDQLCYDSFSGRWFNGSVEDIKWAMNKINNQINNHGYASLNEFWGEIGLPETSAGEEVGWNHSKLMSIEFSTCLAPSGKAAISLDYKVMPVRNYFLHG